MIQTFRQSFRGRMYHVVRDPANNQFFRLNEATYFFVAMLDGKRTVSEVWEICNNQLGDAAPTQGEAIQTLGQLYSLNLLHADLPPDARGMFERYRKRIRREVGSYFMNLLFVRIPLYDPEHLLNAWLPAARWLFTWAGAAIWLAIIATGGYFLVGRIGQLADRAAGILDADNLILLYLSFALLKLFHEFGHAFACKAMGQRTGTGGEVHTIGIMFLVFMPIPYVDASSSSAFRNKWQRALVGAIGIIIEMAFAAIAVIIWTQTSEGGSLFVRTVHAIAYNIIFVAGVSTLFFNGNPLLRYDGYYVLTDLLEMPNLAQRSREYLQYLVKKYVYKVRRPTNPARTPGEARWLFAYAIASGLYRVWISVRIFFFVAAKFFFIGTVLACSALVGWVFMPLGRWLKYLATSPELHRTRTRAVGWTAGSLAAIVLGVALVPAPDRARAQGVVEPRDVAIIYAEVDGFVQTTRPSGAAVTPDDPQALVTARNRDLEARRDELIAERKLTRVEAQQAFAQDTAKMQILDDKIAFLTEQIAYVDDQLGKLAIAAPFKGTWIAPNVDRLRGAYLKQGDRVGIVATDDDLIIRVVADQTVGPRVESEIDPGGLVEIRLKGRPDIELTGTIDRVLPAGSERLPSAALGYTVGGSMAVDLKDPEGTKATEPFFEVVVDPQTSLGATVPLYSGQRVVVRFEMRAKPLGVQWWRSLKQLFQKRFR